MRQWRQLQYKALALFDSSKDEDLEQARSLLLQQLSLKPSHPVPLYNLACAESRLRNHDSALSYLEKSIESGYSNLQHMESDSDLDNIRELDGYKKLVETLKARPVSETEGGCGWWGRGRGRGRGWGRHGGWRAFENMKIQSLFEKGSREDLEEARDILKQQNARRPHRPGPIYNLACVEARLGNVPEALDYLTKAVHAGWRDVDHMERDSDLESLRQTIEYQSLVSLLKIQQQEILNPSFPIPKESPVTVQPNPVPEQPNPVPVKPTTPVPAQSQSQPNPKVQVPSQSTPTAYQSQSTSHPHPWDWWGNLQPNLQWTDVIRRQVNGLLGLETLNTGDYVQDEEQFQALLESLADKI